MTDADAGATTTTTTTTTQRRLRLLLLGAGHAHAQVLRSWAAQPVPGVDLVLVSPTALAPYSGMVPGWLAGTYRFEDVCLNFAALAAAAGALFHVDSLLAMDADARQVLLASGQVLHYDLLSVNVGSTLMPPALDVAPAVPAAPAALAPAAPPGAAGLPSTPAAPALQVLPLRPLGKLLDAWTALQAAATAAPDERAPLTVTAVGGGAAGFESLLAVLARLRALQPRRPIQGRLVTRSDRLLPGFAPGAVRAAERALVRAGARLHTGQAFDAASAAPGGVLGGGGSAGSGAGSGTAVQAGAGGGAALQAGAGLVLWATGAQAHRWQARSGLAVSAQGFIRVNGQLQSVSHPEVFAVGDCAEWSTPLPKAGVFAVRMGPVLTRNLRAALAQAALSTYQPQRRFLALLATADGRAIGSRGRLWAEGRWLWRWKDHIDCGFLARFTPAPPKA